MEHWSYCARLDEWYYSPGGGIVATLFPIMKDWWWLMNGSTLMKGPFPGIEQGKADVERWWRTCSGS